MYSTLKREEKLLFIKQKISIFFTQISIAKLHYMC